MMITYSQDMRGLRIGRKLGIISPRNDVLEERPKKRSRLCADIL